MEGSPVHPGTTHSRCCNSIKQPRQLKAYPHPPLLLVGMERPPVHPRPVHSAQPVQPAPALAQRTPGSCTAGTQAALVHCKGRGGAGRVGRVCREAGGWRSACPRPLQGAGRVGRISSSLAGWPLAGFRAAHAQPVSESSRQGSTEYPSQLGNQKVYAPPLAERRRYLMPSRQKAAAHCITLSAWQSFAHLPWRSAAGT